MKSSKASLVLLLSPPLIYLAIFFAYPLCILFWYSLQTYALFSGRPIEFSGLANYVAVISDEQFLPTIGRTLLYTIVVVSGSFLLGLGYAILVNSVKHRGFATVLRTAILAPMMLIPVSAAVAWKYMYSESYGWINFIAQALGFQRQVWLASPYAFLCVMITDIWGWSPFMFLILFAGLKTIPAEPLEAAQIDGASGLKKFRYVTLPLLKPLIYIALTLKFLDTYKAFDYLWIMTKGGPGDTTMTLTLMSYLVGFQNLNFGVASTWGVFTMLLPLIIVVVYLFVKRK